MSKHLRSFMVVSAEQHKQDVQAAHRRRLVRKAYYATIAALSAFHPDTDAYKALSLNSSELGDLYDDLLTSR